MMNSTQSNRIGATMKLTKEGKEDVAFALILLKDFKSGGKFDPDLIIKMWQLADYLEVRQEYDDLCSKVPPMLVKQRYE